MSRTVTLLQLRTDIAAQCDFSTSTNGRYTPTLLNRLVNQSIQRFRERVSNEGITHFLTSATGTLPQGVTSPYAFQTLDLSSLSPSLVRTYGVDITVAGIVRSLTHRPFQDRNEYTIGPTMTGQPEAWAHFQTRSLAIMPGPDASYPYTIWYLPVLADLVSDSDTFDGVAGWEVWVMWDCVCQLIARDQYASAYTQAIAERDLAWQDIMRSSTRVSNAGGAVLGRDSMGRAGLWGRGPRREIGAAIGSNLPPLSSVSNAMLVSRNGPIVIGRLDPTTGAPEDIPIPSLTSYMGKFAGGLPGLVPSGTGNIADSLRGDGSWGNSTTGASGLSPTLLAPIPSPRILGRISGGSGPVEILVPTQVATMLPLFTAQSKGLVPAPSGVTGVFLGQSGWASAAGGGPTMLAAGGPGAVQYNGGSAFAGASGLIFHAASGLAVSGNQTIGGFLALGQAPPQTGGLRLSNQLAIRGTNAGGTGSLFLASSEADNATYYGDPASSALYVRTGGFLGIRPSGSSADLARIFGDRVDLIGMSLNGTTAVRMTIGNVQKAQLDAQQMALANGVRLGVPQLANSSSDDKLGAWTPSGFANVATGVRVGASGMNVQVGASGPTVHGSGIHFGGFNDIQSVRRINEVEGQKVFGNLGGSSATATVAINAGSGSVFIIPPAATVGQLYSLQPSAIHGDALLLQNRSVATQAIYNLGTGMGAPSGLLFYINPSGAAWTRFASGAWELGSRFQMGGF